MVWMGVSNPPEEYIKLSHHMKRLTWNVGLAIDGILWFKSSPLLSLRENIFVDLYCYEEIQKRLLLLLEPTTTTSMPSTF